MKSDAGVTSSACLDRSPEAFDHAGIFPSCFGLESGGKPPETGRDELPYFRDTGTGPGLQNDPCQS